MSTRYQALAAAAELFLVPDDLSPRLLVRPVRLTLLGERRHAWKRSKHQRRMRTINSSRKLRRSPTLTFFLILRREQLLEEPLLEPQPLLERQLHRYPSISIHSLKQK